MRAAWNVMIDSPTRGRVEHVFRRDLAQYCADSGSKWPNQKRKMAATSHARDIWHYTFAQPEEVETCRPPLYIVTDHKNTCWDLSPQWGVKGKYNFSLTGTIAWNFAAVSEQCGGWTGFITSGYHTNCDTTVLNQLSMAVVAVNLLLYHITD